MALQLLLKTLEGVDEAIQKLYIKEGEGYKLDTEGKTEDSKKVDEFRTNNLLLMKEVADMKTKMSGIDLDAFKDFLKTKQDTTEAELLKAGKIDELFDSRTSVMRAKHEDDLKKLQTKNTSMANTLTTTLISGALAKEAVSSKIKKTAIEDVISRGGKVFQLNEANEVIAMEGDKIKHNKDAKPYNIADFMTELQTSAPHLFEGSSGGNSNSNQNANNHTSTVNRSDKKNWDIEAIASGKQQVV